jgi:hypothetical protein
VIRQLFLWPNQLEELHFEWGTSVADEDYGWNQEQLQELLDPLQGKLKSLTIGPYQGGVDRGDTLFHTSPYTEDPPYFGQFHGLHSLKLTNWEMYQKTDKLSLNIFSCPTLKNFAIVYFQQENVLLQKTQLEVLAEEITLSAAHFSPLEEVVVCFDCTDESVKRELAVYCSDIAQRLAPRINLRHMDSQVLLNRRYESDDHSYLEFL